MKSQPRGTIVFLIRDTQAAEAGDRPRQVTIGTLPALDLLEHEARRRGFHFVRRDRPELRDELNPILLWHFGSFAVLPRQLRKAARGRIIGWCLESPLVAHRAYHRLDRIAADCSHLFAFPGARELVDGSASFHDLHWPNENISPRADDWEQRDHLVMIASNKKANAGLETVDLKNPYRTLRVLAAGMLGRTYAIRKTWTVPDHYRLRLQAITHFSQHEGFNLYGVGWQRDTPRKKEFEPGVKASYRGAIHDKLTALRTHRFALCFENTVFPGYITEKIFDCFRAGTIPVYLGAPDVSSYIPEGCFIDLREFDDFESLRRFLWNMTPSQAATYHEAVLRFVRSSTFRPFTQEHFTDHILGAVEDVAARA